MSEDAAGPSGGAAGHQNSDPGNHHETGKIMPQLKNDSRKSTWTKSAFDLKVEGLATPVGSQSRRTSHHGIDLDGYFVGPRDMDAHSKLPYFMRLHGSVLPRMILPLFCVGAWATCITCISKFVYNLGVSTLLLTVLGFVVGLALSFRSTTAYERYADGRKSWTLLSVHARNLARYIWVHIDEQEGPDAKEDLLAKVTAINLILAFAVSLKHRLRFEPYAHYPDIACLVNHLDTFAKNAHTEKNFEVPKKTPWKAVGEYLGLDFASSNPRKAIKRADKPLGNLPLEILTYISSYIEETSVNGTLKNAVILGQMMTAISALTETQSSAERVLTTPLPIGYNILISQIVLLYVYLLPFQLFESLQWVTIPGTIAAAYIILGLAAIGNELENPFGNDVNDLPLDSYCAELSRELDTLMSVPAPRFREHMGLSKNLNQPLWPLSHGAFGEWRSRSESDIRSALRAKAYVKNGHAIEEKMTVTPQSVGSTLA